TNEFARIYGINPATARKGLNLLVDENILFTRRGLGMFVCKGARERILQKRQKKFLSEVLPQIVKEASRLEISLSRLIEYMEECKEGEL
ncbi:MAG TPA: GntR family transcriptional regulator, partial [Tissierellaceae bacterium]|nr:GntR family transcriptional regulator [Tissierellaceae bacterium]